MGWLDDGADYPPPGRTRVTFDEARALLVEHPRFAHSTTRPGLWERLIDYVTRFLALEADHKDLLDGQPLVQFLWLGGSFVSGKVDPRNIDLTVALDTELRDRLKGKSYTGWLRAAFEREKILADYSISPLHLPYRAVASPFRPQQLDVADQQYLLTRGAWDDWWQRRRATISTGVVSGPPTRDTAKAARGYLEVIL
jgi:hypothetical protein